VLMAAIVNVWSVGTWEQVGTNECSWFVMDGKDRITRRLQGNLYFPMECRTKKPLQRSVSSLECAGIRNRDKDHEHDEIVLNKGRGHNLCTSGMGWASRPSQIFAAFV